METDYRRFRDILLSVKYADNEAGIIANFEHKI